MTQKSDCVKIYEMYAITELIYAMMVYKNDGIGFMVS
jgi:hypothetical protein